MIQIVNMTPHSVNLLDENDQEVCVFLASGKTIRLSVNTTPDEPISVAGIVIPTSKTVFGEVEGLPNYQELGWQPVFGSEVVVEYSSDPKTYYIVSQLVKNALPHRRDLLVPAEVQRSKEGLILGCRSLGR